MVVDEGVSAELIGSGTAVAGETGLSTQGGSSQSLIDKFCSIIGMDVSDSFVETDLYLLQKFNDELCGFIFLSYELNPSKPRIIIEDDQDWLDSQGKWEGKRELPGTIGFYIGTTLDLVSLVKGHCSPKVNIRPVGLH
nr:hypothetical protein [Tanacetum cinerariifolium]